MWKLAGSVGSVGTRLQGTEPGRRSSVGPTQKPTKVRDFKIQPFYPQAAIDRQGRVLGINPAESRNCSQGNGRFSNVLPRPCIFTLIFCD